MQVRDISKDPFLGFRFRVELNGIEVAGFSEISGLSCELELEEHREGGVNTHTHKFPKMAKYPNLVLKRGMTDSRELWAWFESAKMGIITPAVCSVIIMNSKGKDANRWNFLRAYPVKWVGPELKADSNGVAIEILEMVHEGIFKI